MLLELLVFAALLRCGGCRVVIAGVFAVPWVYCLVVILLAVVTCGCCTWVALGLQVGCFLVFLWVLGFVGLRY